MSVIKGHGSGEVSTGFYPYSIEQSLRFNDPDNSYLYRTPSNQGSLTTFTYSFWYKRSVFGTYQEVLHVYPGSGERSQILFMNNDTLKVELESGNTNHFLTNMLFRDSSAFYHVVVAFDSTNGTQANRVKIYVNGVDQSDTANGGGGFSTANYPSQNATSGFNTTSQHEISTYDGSDYHLDGYLAEVNFVDGTALTAASFGETIDGIWVPKDSSGLTFGTNGFHLKFVSGAIGTDSSGNGHTWTYSTGNTSRNRPVQNSPTNNFCVIPYTNTSYLAHEHQGMRINTARTAQWDGVAGSFSVKSGKWYYEVQLNVGSGDLFRSVVGWKQAPEEAQKVFNRQGSSGDPFGTGSGDLGNTGHYAYQSWNTQFYGNGGYTGTSISASSSDVINVAVDFDNSKIYFGKNGTYIANDGGTDGNPANGTNESLSGLLDNGKFYSPSVAIRSDNTAGSNSVRFNFGLDRSFGANYSLGTAYADGNGFGEFRYEVPSGFLSLCSQNLPDVDIIDGTQFFNTAIWVGNNQNNRAIPVGFQPDFSWTQTRTQYGNGSELFDSVRGAGKSLKSETTAAEVTNKSSGYIGAFTSTGFTTADGSSHNASINYNDGGGQSYIAWNWKAGTAFSNDASATSVGTIDSAGQVNTTAGFSIIGYTGTRGSDAGETGTPTLIAHGLGKKPTWFMTKRRDGASDWNVWHQSYQPDQTYFNYQLKLNENAASNNAGFQRMDGTNLSSTVFAPARYSYDDVSGATYIAYVFTDIVGYSKTGSYLGNGSTDGPFIFTGFRPAWIMIKKAAASEAWWIVDSVRETTNPLEYGLQANSAATELTASKPLDFLSNGFKPKVSTGYHNDNGATYVFMAFAEQPFKFANAR